MNNIYDYFTGKAFEQITKQDTSHNDAVTDELGIYLGALGKKYGDKLRSTNNELEFLRNQIDMQMKQLDQLEHAHRMNLVECLYLLGKGTSTDITRINLDTDTIMVDENDNVWVIYS